MQGGDRMLIGATVARTEDGSVTILGLLFWIEAQDPLPVYRYLLTAHQYGIAQLVLNADCEVSLVLRGNKQPTDLVRGASDRLLDVGLPPSIAEQVARRLFARLDLPPGVFQEIRPVEVNCWR